jgi:hypothetical protein
MKNDTQQTPLKNDDAAQKSRTPAVNGKKAERHSHSSAERPSLAEERAEGEGMIAPAADDKASALEGEGSHTATHHYDEGVARSVAEGHTEELARKAAQALDGPEGPELRKAEQAAKHGHSS